MNEILVVVAVVFLGAVATALALLALAVLRASHALRVFTEDFPELVHGLEARLKATEESVTALRHQLHNIGQAIRDIGQAIRDIKDREGHDA